MGITPIEMAMKNVYTMVYPIFRASQLGILGSYNKKIGFPEIDSTVGLNDAQAVADDDPCFLL